MKITVSFYSDIYYKDLLKSVDVTSKEEALHEIEEFRKTYKYQLYIKNSVDGEGFNDRQVLDYLSNSLVDSTAFGAIQLTEINRKK